MSKSAKVVLAVIIVLLGIGLALAFSKNGVSFMSPSKTTSTTVKKATPTKKPAAKKPVTKKPVEKKPTAHRKSGTSMKAQVKPVTN